MRSSAIRTVGAFPNPVPYQIRSEPFRAADAVEYDASVSTPARDHDRCVPQNEGRIGQDQAGAGGPREGDLSGAGSVNAADE